MPPPNDALLGGYQQEKKERKKTECDGLVCNHHDDDFPVREHGQQREDLGQEIQGSSDRILPPRTLATPDVPSERGNVLFGAFRPQIKGNVLMGRTCSMLWKKND